MHNAHSDHLAHPRRAGTRGPGCWRAGSGGPACGPTPCRSPASSSRIAAAARSGALGVVAGPARSALLLAGRGGASSCGCLCNLLDGMLAVEQGLKSTTGDIFNDLPDRVADVAHPGRRRIRLRQPARRRRCSDGRRRSRRSSPPTCGCSAGRSASTQHFIGPMAKQHRMFTLTVATLLAAVERCSACRRGRLRIGLAIIVAGSVVTAVRRTRRIVREVEAR